MYCKDQWMSSTLVYIGRQEGFQGSGTHASRVFVRVIDPQLRLSQYDYNLTQKL